MLILEIAAGVFLGPFVFLSFLAWRTVRQVERKCEAQLLCEGVDAALAPENLSQLAQGEAALTAIEERERH
jgi:hypothetical protein